MREKMREIKEKKTTNLNYIISYYLMESIQVIYENYSIDGQDQSSRWLMDNTLNVTSGKFTKSSA